MKKKIKDNLFVLICFLIAIIIAFSGFTGIIKNKKIINQENQKFQNLIPSTTNRVINSVITIPDTTTLVQLQDGNGKYKDPINEKDGLAILIKDKIKTTFIEGVYKQKNPRIDALAPIYINNDNKGGSLYIMLFNDRGDAAIEKSYMRIGGVNTEVENIEITEISNQKQEYSITIFYTIKNIKEGELITENKKATISVNDGKFDPESVVVE